jgi:hypothetical protein
MRHSFLLPLPVITGLLLSCCLLAACKTTPQQRVVIDPKGIDQAAYERDLAECNTLAENAGKTGSAGKGALGGAVIGGAIGGILGNRTSAARLGGVGAVVGGARGAGQEGGNKDQILKNCMSGRGYRVLN